MLSHGCFFAALLVYYIPKAFGKKTRFIINLHMVLGSLSVLGMLYETAMKLLELGAREDMIAEAVGHSVEEIKRWKNDMKH